MENSSLLANARVGSLFDTLQTQIPIESIFLQNDAVSKVFYAIPHFSLVTFTVFYMIVPIVQYHYIKVFLSFANSLSKQLTHAQADRPSHISGS